MTGLNICAGWVLVEDRFGSFEGAFSRVPVLEVLDAAIAAEDSGAAKEFFTRENNDDTRVYEDSCSSSSEKGLKLVKLVTSSTILVELLLDLRGPVLPEGTVGEVG